MWAVYIVEVQTRHSRETRILEVGCSGEREAERIGRIWFPEDRYVGHRVYRKLRPVL
jgi:hypothetical protein